MLPFDPLFPLVIFCLEPSCMQFSLSLSLFTLTLQYHSEVGQKSEKSFRFRLSESTECYFDSLASSCFRRSLHSEARMPTVSWSEVSFHRLVSFEELVPFEELDSLNTSSLKAPFCHTVSLLRPSSTKPLRCSNFKSAFSQRETK